MTVQLLAEGSSSGSGGGALLLAVLIAGAVSKGPGRTAHGHFHGGGDKRRRALHEMRHAVAARATGGRVESIHIRNGGGAVQARGIPNARAHLVFLLAGGVGDKRGCSGDNDDVRQVLKEFPRSQRSYELARAKREAARIVRQNSAKIQRGADKLVRGDQP